MSLKVVYTGVLLMFISKKNKNASTISTLKNGISHAAQSKSEPYFSAA